VSVKAITLGTTDLNPGEGVSTLAGLQQLDVDNVRVDGNTISSTDTDGNIVLDPNGTGSVDVSSSRVVNVAAPVDAGDAANKVYVDSVAQGLDVKQSVRVATSAQIDLSDVSVIDGVTLQSGDRVLVKSQTLPAENGIYVHSNGVLARSEDADAPNEMNAGTFVFVEEGAAYADTGWVVSSDNPLAIGTDPIAWTQFSGAGTYLAGYGLTLTGNTFAVDDEEIVNHTELNTAVSDLTDYIDGFLDPSTGTTVEYIDTQDAATLLAANGYSDALVAAGDPTATPTYLAVDINSIAKQVAATTTVSPGVEGQFGGGSTVYSFASEDYRSAKFLIKMAHGSHTEISELLLTLDTSNNIAVTEYAVVGTNGSLGTISAGISSGSNVSLAVDPANADTIVTVMGTLLV
jgi:hypothetical protein